MLQKHLININSLSKASILSLIETANVYIKNNSYSKHISNILEQKTVANLFFENSTRTRCSFELAAKRLGAQVLTLDLASSSTQKGESLLDTIYTLEAMHVDAFIVRHQEEGTACFISQHLSSQARVINAGDGIQNHPTQALLDNLTIWQHKPNFADLSIAIVGDLAHSRVARSNLEAWELLDVPDIRLIAPPNFISQDLQRYPATIYHDFNAGIKDVDIVMMLRIQKERMDSKLFPNTKAYFKQYALTTERLKLAKPDALVMHPGPMNRGIEIAPEVADCSQSVIQEQVRNGVAMRMAILETLLT